MDTPLYFFQIEIVVHVNSISLSRLIGLAKSSDKFVSKNFYATACAWAMNNPDELVKNPWMNRKQLAVFNYRHVWESSSWKTQ